MALHKTIKKSLEINKNSRIYGSFAEIGAGQETANYFFKAGLASHTIAKSMSAYDMVFSDEIYGKQNRYVCKDRLLTMLNHEYGLLEKRLTKTRGKKSQFFAFATTAVTSKKKSPFSKDQHAWMGLRFQTKPLTPFNEITFHVNCLDKVRLKQYEALGILGVNLIHAAFHHYNNPQKFLASLLENLEDSRVEISAIHCAGSSLKKLKNDLINQLSVKKNLAQFSLFSSNKKSPFVGDVIFEKPLTVIYGNDNLIQQAQKRMKKSALQSPCLYISSEVKSNSKLQKQIQKLRKKNHYLLLTQKPTFCSLKSYLSAYTSKPLNVIISDQQFKQILDSSDKQNFLNYLNSFFDNKTKLMICSQNQKLDLKNHPAIKKKKSKIHSLISKKQIVKI